MLKSGHFSDKTQGNSVIFSCYCLSELLVKFKLSRLSNSKQGYVPLNHLKKIPKNAQGDLMKTVLADNNNNSKKEKGKKNCLFI